MRKFMTIRVSYDQSKDGKERPTKVRVRLQRTAFRRDSYDVPPVQHVDPDSEVFTLLVGSNFTMKLRIDDMPPNVLFVAGDTGA